MVNDPNGSKVEQTKYVIELIDIKNFIKKNLNKVTTNEKVYLPTQEDIARDKVYCNLLSGIGNFDKDGLKHIDTVENNILPNVCTLRSELIPDIIPTKIEIDELKDFVKLYLKNVETVEKNLLPTKEDIKDEAIYSRADVKIFDKNSLKKVEPVIKNTIPNLQTLASELLPEGLPSKMELEGLKSFAKSSLRSTETIEKNPLPTSELIEQEKNSLLNRLSEFNKNDLKHIDVVEANYVPDVATLRSELMPDYLPTKVEAGALKSLISRLNQTNVNVKNILPTFEDINKEKVSTRAEVKTFDKSSLKCVNQV